MVNLHFMAKREGRINEKVRMEEEGVNMNAPLQRVLLLEDVEANAQLARFALESISGFEVKHARDGDEAIEMFRVWKPDVCLFDYLMPQKSGLEVMQELLNTQSAAKQIPFVFLTARTDITNARMLKEAGAREVIPKPFDIMLLGSQLADVYHGATLPQRHERAIGRKKPVETASKLVAKAAGAPAFIGPQRELQEQREQRNAIR